MIKVLHCIDTTGPGGAETVFINLAKGLDPGKFTSIAAIRGPGWVCDNLRKNNIEPIFINSKGGFNIGYLGNLIRIIGKHKIDVILSHLFGSNLYCSIAGLICRVPVISTMHGFVDTCEKERLMKLKTFLINRGSKKIVFVSSQLREYFVNTLGFSTSKAFTIYNGIDTDVFYSKQDTSIRNPLGIGPENILIGAIGNIRPAKGYDIFLRAAHLLHKHYPHCRFCIAGQGDGPLYEELLKLRKNLELDDVFFFLGFQGDAPKVYNNLDIFVLPSTSEGFSISTIEAMACKVPVVATKSGGPEEIISDGVHGLLSDTTAQSLFEKISQLLDDSSIRKLIVRHASQHVQNSFSNTKTIEAYSQLLQIQ